MTDTYLKLPILATRSFPYGRGKARWKAHVPHTRIEAWGDTKAEAVANLTKLLESVLETERSLYFSETGAVMILEEPPDRESASAFHFTSTEGSRSATRGGRREGHEAFFEQVHGPIVKKVGLP